MGNKGSSLAGSQHSLRAEYGTALTDDVPVLERRRSFPKPIIGATTALALMLGALFFIPRRAVEPQRHVSAVSPEQVSNVIYVIESRQGKATQMEETLTHFGPAATVTEGAIWHTGTKPSSKVSGMNETDTPPDQRTRTLLIDSTHKFQQIEGFGGAFTEAAALVFAHLSEADQDR
jgi:hypothetical protein